jgi:AAA family ATP:ADP antiporter
MRRVINWQRHFGSGARGAAVDTPLGGHFLAAFHQVIRSPYLLGIAVFVILLSWVSTFLYLEQQAFVAKVFASRDERTRFFSDVDFWVQTFSLITQLFVFGRLYKWIGLRSLLVSVPLIMTLGYGLFALLPTFAVLVGVLAVRRVGEYAITRPSRDSLYTVCTREEKYKAKSLIDTFIYRGGDATSASVYQLLTVEFGFGPSGVGWVGALISAVWMMLALSLGKSHEREGRQTAPVELGGAKL